MLRKGIIKKTVSNIMHYYTEYLLDKELIRFINKCDVGMDYSQIETNFGDEIAKQFFDSVAVNNDIETGKYQEILCDMEYTFNLYDIYDIDSDKMKVLIKNNIIEMNENGLEYIRTYYKEYIELYIDQNIKEYIELIASDNFSYDEALYVLGNKIEDEEKIKLLSLTENPISVVGKGYSNKLVEYILDNNFDEHDESELYKNFSKYEEAVQSSIYKRAESRIDSIIENSSIVLDNNLLSELLINSECSTDDKIQLWAKAIPTLTEETCKKHFDELGFPELKHIFTKRNNFSRTYEGNSYIRDILEELKKNTWIYDYYLTDDGERYIVVKHQSQGKKY